MKLKPPFPEMCLYPHTPCSKGISRTGEMNEVRKSYSMYYLEKGRKEEYYGVYN